MRIAALIAICVTVGSVVPALSDGSKTASSSPAITDVSQQDHKEAVAHYNKGVDFHQSGFYTQAIDEYLAAIAKEPGFYQAWANLGAAYTAQHRSDEAEAAFKKAATFRDNHSVTLNGYATALYVEGRTDEAIAIWRKLIESDPTFKQAAPNLMHALDSRGRHEEADEVRKKFARPLKDTEPLPKDLSSGN